MNGLKKKMNCVMIFFFFFLNSSFYPLLFRERLSYNEITRMNVRKYNGFMTVSSGK